MRKPKKCIECKKKLAKNFYYLYERNTLEDENKIVGGACVDCYEIKGKL